MTSSAMTDEKCYQLIKRAHEAATRAAKNFSGDDSLKGRAFVILKPATTKLALWLKDFKWHPSAYVGVYQDVRGFYMEPKLNTESIERRECGARAFAKVLNDAGYKTSVITQLGI